MTRQLGLLALALGGVGLATCVYGVDPDEGRFACSGDPDCGQGYECRPQARGGGLCYRLGECAATERCDGTDDDCDGLTDEGFDLASDEAHCGACGNACPAGTTCRSGACAESRCADGLDNDGDGRPDCADPDCAGLECSPGRNCSAAGAADGGTPDGGTTDGGAPDAGTPDGACLPREQACGNGLDDDLDGPPDCADPDCDGRACAGGKVCAARACPP